MKFGDQTSNSIYKKKKLKKKKKKVTIHFSFIWKDNILTNN